MKFLNFCSADLTLPAFFSPLSSPLLKLSRSARWPIPPLCATFREGFGFGVPALGSAVPLLGLGLGVPVLGSAVPRFLGLGVPVLGSTLPLDG